MVATMKKLSKEGIIADNWSLPDKARRLEERIRFKIWLTVVEYREIVQRKHKELLKQICRNDEILKVIEVQDQTEILKVRWFGFYLNLKIKRL